MTQLDTALLALRDRVEGALQAIAPQTAPHAVMSPPFDANGRPAPNTRGRTLLTLAAIRMDAARRNAPPGRAGEAPWPSAPLEADVLVTVNDLDLARAAARLAALVAALHAAPVLIEAGDPTRNGAVTVELANLSYEEAAHVIGLAGIKGMPFALYRLRGIRAGG